MPWSNEERSALKCETASYFHPQTDRLIHSLLHRSQRDTRGEQEQRLQQLKELQEQVQKLEDRMRTAANDRRQFEHALTKNQQDINENQ